MSAKTHTKEQETPISKRVNRNKNAEKTRIRIFLGNVIAMTLLDLLYVIGSWVLGTNVASLIIGSVFTLIEIGAAAALIFIRRVDVLDVKRTLIYLAIYFGMQVLWITDAAMLIASSAFYVKTLIMALVRLVVFMLNAALFIAYLVISRKLNGAKKISVNQIVRIVFLIIVIAIIPACYAGTSDFKVGIREGYLSRRIEYELTEDGNYVVKSVKAGLADKVVIPDKVNGKDVVGISKDAFYDDAFIGFFGTHITEVDVSANVMTIEEGAFSALENVKTIILRGDEVKQISKDAFPDGDKLKIQIAGSNLNSAAVMDKYLATANEHTADFVSALGNKISVEGGDYFVFHTNGGTAIPTVKTTQTVLSEPSLEGCEFVGWSTDLSYETTLSASQLANLDANGSVHLYAKYRYLAPTQFDIVRYIDEKVDQTGTAIYGNKVQYYATVSLPASDKVVMEWLNEEGNTVTSLPLSDTQNGKHTKILSLTDVAQSGTYHLNAKVVSDVNYIADSEYGYSRDVSISISPREVDVNLSYDTTSYSASIPNVTASYNDISGVSQAITVNPDRTILNAGEYTLSYSITDGNYKLKTTTGKFTVTKAQLNVTPSNTSVIYGTQWQRQVSIQNYASNESTASRNSIYNSVINALNCGTYSINSPVGSYPVNLSLADTQNLLENYTINFVEGNVEVLKKQLTVAAKPQTIIYGDDVPSLGADIEGYALDENFDSEIIRRLFTEYYIGSPVDKTYPIELNTSYTPTDNYYITYTPADIKVERKTLYVSAQGQEIIYGTAAADLYAGMDGFSYVDSDKTEDLITLVLNAISTTYEAGADVGEYAISLYDNELLENYIIEYTGAYITVNKATLEVSASDISIEYGDIIPNFVLSYGQFAATEHEGLIEDLKVVVNANIRTDYRMGDPVGEYDISLLNAEVLQNYTINYTAAALSVETRKVTIKSGTFAPKTKVYGEADPEFAYSLTGVNNETLVFTLTREEGQNVNTYAIAEVASVTVDGGNGDTGNYSITTEVVGNDILSITPAELHVTGNAQGVTYGENIQPLTAEISGQKYSEDFSEEIYSKLSTTYTQGASVDGFYRISIESGYCPSDNYTLVYHYGYITVFKRTLTVTANTASVTYGDEKPTLSAQISGYYSDDNFDSEITEKLFTGYIKGAAAGTYAIVLTDTNFLTDYSIDYTGANISVGKKSITVSSGAFEAKTKVYGEADPDLTYSVDGVNGETLVFAINRSSGENASAYTINSYSVRVEGGTITDTRNYDIHASVTGDTILNVTKAELRVQPTNTTVIYGTPWVKQASITGYVSIETETSQASIYDSVIAALDCGTYSVGSSVGSYPVTLNTQLANYNINYVAANIEVQKKQLNVNATAQSIIYGDAVPSLGASITGYVLGENYDSVILQKLSTSYTVGSNIGAYEISIADGYAPSGNYTIAFTSANITVGKATLAVSAIPQDSVIYGNAAESLNADISGFVPADSANQQALTQTILNGLSASYEVGDDVGSYPIVFQNLNVLENYNIEYTGANITVNKAKLDVEAVGCTISYCDAIPYFILNCWMFASTDDSDTVEDLKNEIRANLSTEYLRGKPIGDYDILLTDTEVLKNYTINYTQGILHVEARKVTIKSGTFEAKTKVYGNSDPESRYSVTGVNNETLVFTLTREEGQDVGTYKVVSCDINVTGGNASLANYAPDVQVVGDNILTITPAELTVTANAKGVAYGDAKPQLDCTVSGYKYDDNYNSQIQANLLTTYVSGSTVGSYPITLTAGYTPSANYTVKYVAANITVTQKAITVAAGQITAGTKVYGEADPAFTCTVNGVNGEIVSLSFTRVSGENTGNYEWSAYNATVTGGNASLANYAITVEKAVVLHITSATLTITPNSNISKTYGDNDGVIGYGVSGLTNGDSESILSGSLSRATGENVGRYAINLGTLKANNNYSLQITEINYIIVEKVITVDVSASKDYGATDPEFRKPVNGVNGETFELTYSRDEGESAGEYGFTVVGVNNTNYTVKLTGKFVINVLSQPQGLEGTEGDALSSIALPVVLNGEWSWANPQATLDKSIAEYEAIFKPKASGASEVRVNLTVSVQPKDEEGGTIDPDDGQEEDNSDVDNI